MRTRMFVALLAVVSAALAIAPATAGARDARGGARCAITMHVAPLHITAGDPVVIFGRLRCPRPAGMLVRLFHRLAGQAGFTPVQRTTTDARGFYEFSRADGVVTTNRAWYVRSAGARSGARALRVSAQVTLDGPLETTALQTGPAHAVTFSGAVDPADVGARVVLQRQNAATGGDDWRRIDVGRVGAGGSFSVVHTFKVPGDANIRVVVRSRARNVPSPSNVLSYVIDQAQNPRLTIAASQDPISFGQSVVISGTLTGGAVQPVILYASTARGGPAAVATTVTDPAGNYSFPAQSPMRSTAYQVKGLNRSSALLYEGVRDVLSASASSNQVAAGTPVTFSGNVSPDHRGHVIYLERQNATDGDFHVIEVATVGSGSSYSIAHRFYDTGTRNVRVYIPGGPENQGAPSQTFAVTVTPAPASSLSPESPGNSSQPSGGQQ